MVCSRRSSEAGCSTVRLGLRRRMGPGGRNFLVVDEEALQTVARTTGGEYFKASDADQLQGVLEGPPQARGHAGARRRGQRRLRGLAALLLLLGLWLAGRWTAHPQ